MALIAWVLISLVLLGMCALLMFGGGKPSVLDDVKGVGKKRHW